MFAMTLSDNLSRLLIAKFTICTTLIGGVLLVLSQNMTFIAFGLFLIGFGVYPICKILLTIISEQSEEHMMKKYMSVSLSTYVIT